MSLQTREVVKPSKLKVWWFGKGADLVGGALIALFVLLCYGAFAISAVFLWRSGNPGLQSIALLLALAMFGGLQLLIKD